MNDAPSPPPNNKKKQQHIIRSELLAQEPLFAITLCFINANKKHTGVFRQKSPNYHRYPLFLFMLGDRTGGGGGWVP